MEEFNVPLMTTQAFNDSQASHSSNHLHKDHMLGTGNTILMPSRSSTTGATTSSSGFLFDVATNRYNDITNATNLKGDLSSFSNCIQPGSLMDQRGSVVVDSSNGLSNLNANSNNIVESNMDGVSMSGLCDFKFPSPSALSNALNNDSNFKNMTPLLSHGNAGNDLNSTESANLPVTSFSNLLFASSNPDQTGAGGGGGGGGVMEDKASNHLNILQNSHYLPMKTISSSDSNRFLARHHQNQAHQLMQNETFPNSNPNPNSTDGSIICENGGLALPSIQGKVSSVTTAASNGNILNFNLRTNITSSILPSMAAKTDSSIISSSSAASSSTTNLNNFNSLTNNLSYIITTSATTPSPPPSGLVSIPVPEPVPVPASSSDKAIVTAVSTISSIKSHINGAIKKCETFDNQITTTTNTCNKNTANSNSNSNTTNTNTITISNSNNNINGNGDVTGISNPGNYANTAGVGNENNILANNHITVISNNHHQQQQQKANLINHHSQQQASNTDGSGNLVTSHHIVSSLHNIEELAVSSCSSSLSNAGNAGGGTGVSAASSSSPSATATGAGAASGSSAASARSAGSSAVATSTIVNNINKTNKTFNKKISSDELQTQQHQIQQQQQQQQQQLQQQQQQQLQLQQLQHQNGHDFSLNSSECDSMSSDDDSIDLEINEHNGYHDNTSSHSQQSNGGSGGGGGGGGTNGNGNNSNNPNSSSLQAAAQAVMGGNAASYMSLLPPSNGNGHLLATSGNGNGTSAGGLVSTGVGGTSATSGNSNGEGIDFKHLFEELCPVCGDKVSGYHYGLLTCESCKGFFKRTVQNKKVYTCVAERSCHIDKTQRKRCPYCRFQKCLEVGMKLEAVRADRMRGGRNKFGPMYKRDRARKLQIMRQRQLALQAIRTTMSSGEMKATPLSPGYQQAYPNMNIKQEIQIPQVSSLTQSPDSSPSPIAIALGQVNPSTSVITTAMNGSSGNGGGGSSGGGGNSNSDLLNRSSSGNCHDPGSLPNTGDSKLCFDAGTHPSSTADSSIEPLRVSPMIREFVQSIDDREWQTQLFALLQKQTYNQVEVDLFELMCKVLDQNLFSQVDWARNTAFFKDLKVDDQMKLLQNSWSDMLVLDHLHHRIHNGLPDETQLNNGQVFNLLGLGLLGVPQLAEYFNGLQNKLQDLKFDMGDYVCMKFLILLNPNVRGILNKKTVLEGHENVQAALLDYTLTCYPSVTNKFSRLLNILPDIHDMAARGEEHLYSKHCAGSAPTQTLLMEMLHAKRKV